MAISLRLDDAEAVLVRDYMEKIEDEYDLQAYEKAIAEYRSDPVAYSLDHVEKELGLV
ncbi:MAG: DUF6290 family protein [Lachnospiraceae bacterium]|nr:DUF6290 family protein [Lachnospiraceae bacterium]